MFKRWMNFSLLKMRIKSFVQKETFDLLILFRDWSILNIKIVCLIKIVYPVRSIPDIMKLSQ